MSTKTEQKNKKTIKERYYPELFDGGRLEVADDIISPNFYNDSHPDWPRGPEGIKRVVRMLHTALDNLHTEIEDIMVEENRVIVWATQSGIWKGTEHLFGTIEPKGTVYRQYQAHRFIFDGEGRVVEHRVRRDDKETRVDEHGRIPQKRT